MALWKRLRLPMIIGMVGILLAQLLGPVSADELSRLRKEQEELSRKIEQRQQELRQTKQQIRNVTSDINKLEQDIEKVQQEIQVLQGQLTDTEAQVRETEAELAAAEARQAERTEFLAARIKEIFINGQVNYLEVLLQASSVNDLLTRMVLLEKLMEQDIALLEEIEAERQVIELKKAELELKRTEIIAIKLDTERKEQELLAKTRERQVWLASLEQDSEALSRALDELEKASQEVEKLILAALAASGNWGEGIVGKAAWPTPGYSRISSDYGMRLHPILRARRMHTGIDIAAPSGTNIVAADFGRVIHADWMGGYGKTVIIDHGQGMSTLYAHQSELLVKKGDDVTKGQVIGKVGSTGQSTGPHLHFEVRINGSHTNPWPYLK